MPESNADIIRETFLAWLATEDSERQGRYITYREDSDGVHDTQLTARMRKFLQLKTGEEFNTVAELLAAINKEKA